MYRAKDAGRNTVVYFETDMQETVRARLALEQDLHQAIAQGELRLLLQPQVDRNGSWSAPKRCCAGSTRPAA
jgi:predicted signal transduction protein with EAL and GGDEF domain